MLAAKQMKAVSNAKIVVQDNLVMLLVKTVKNASLIIIRTKIKNPIRSYAKYTHSMSKVLALIVNNILYAEY